MTTLISIPAGRSLRRTGTKLVDAMPTKGTMELHQGDDFMELKWRNGENGEIQEELMLFPGDATFKKVEQDRSGRTHVLSFNSSDQKYFFWFQRKALTQDARDAADFNGYLQDPAYVAGSAPVAETSAPTDQAAGAATGEAAASGSGNAGSSTIDTAAGAGAGQEEMARLLADWARSGALTQGAADDDARLTDVLSPANIASLLASKPDLVQTLTPLLPPGLDLPQTPTAQDLVPILQAPQFTDAIASLDNALRSGGLPGSMMRELGLAESAGTSVKAFLEALMGLAPGSGAAGGDAMETD